VDPVTEVWKEAFVDADPTNGAKFDNSGFVLKEAISNPTIALAINDSLSKPAACDKGQLCLFSRHFMALGNRGLSI